MLIGTLYLLAACLCWSLVFVIPGFLTGFSSLEISLGRFFFFGITSVFLLFFKKRNLLHSSFKPIWKKAFLLGGVSTVVCYTCTLLCIQYANAATAALLFGTVPIIVVLCGNWRQKEYPFRIFLLPCLIMGVGVVLVNADIFFWHGEGLSSYLVGALLGAVGVGCWIWYVIASFDFMEKSTSITSVDWVAMLGSVVFAQVLFVGCIGFWTLEDAHRYFSFTDELQYFLWGCLVLGVVSSWGALYCWTQANLRLPIVWVGHLAIFELIFGLGLIFLVESRFPDFSEIIGIVFMVGGVFQGLYSLEKNRIR